MKAAILSLLVFAAPLLAHASSDNGVERGTVTVDGNASIPKGLEDRLESLIFGNCDLRGASSITTAYLKVSASSPLASPANDYEIQYSVAFKDGSAPALITVHALLHLDAAAFENGIELLALSSPICKTLP
jgi:hypothetical protein